MRRVLALLLFAALATAACPTGRDDLAQVPLAAPVAAPGQLVVHLPPLPTTVGVVVLHSFGHTAAEPVLQGWSRTADRHGFAAFYPYRGGAWNAGLCCGAPAATGRDDVAWLTAVITDARHRYRLRTIYLAGFSNGGMMAERLVAEQPGTTSRIVTWGAAPEMPEPGRWSGIAVLYRGERDDTVPASGGTRMLGSSPAVFRPGTRTAAWLPSAHLQSFVVPGAAHSPPPAWPELAWRALNAPAGLAPAE